MVPIVGRFFLLEDDEEILNSNYSTWESARDLNEKDLNSLDEELNDEALNYLQKLSIMFVNIK